MTNNEGLKKGEVAVDYVVLNPRVAKLDMISLESYINHVYPILFTRVENRNEVPFVGSQIDYKDDGSQPRQHLEKRGFTGDLSGKYRVVASILYDGLGRMSKIGIVKVE